MTLNYEHLWVVDVEGNGASPPEIVELALVEVKAMQLTGKTHHWFIKPEKPISHHVTRIHGITNDDLIDAPSMEDIEDEVYLWLEDAPIIGHNVKVEVNALRHSLEAWSPVAAVDTLRLAKRAKPGLESYSLENLGSKLGLNEPAASLTGRKHHSALFDATLTGLLFLELLKAIPTTEQRDAITEADILHQSQGQLL